MNYWEFDDKNIDVDEGWSVKNLDDAAWASRRAASARSEERKVLEWAEREKERIDKIVERETKSFVSTAEFFEHHLHVYLKKEIDDGRKKKSLELPGGVIRLTKRQNKLLLDDESKVLSFLEEQYPELLRVKKSVALSYFRKAIDFAEGGTVVINGEIIEGMRWEEQPDSASFSPAVEVEND